VNAPRRKRKPLTAAGAARAQLDMFGEVPVTRDDVYAWLLAVVDLDPATIRAFSYVNSYGVLNKIIRAKLDGTFDELVAPAKHSARMKELKNAPAVDLATNRLGLGDFGKPKPRRLHTKSLRAPRRAADVIREERERAAAAKAGRQAIDATALRRLPKAMPPLSMMLDDIGNPPPDALAAAFDVSETTARRWLSDERAPLAVQLALFWLTKWGVSQVDATAHNDAAMAAQRAASLRREVESLREVLAKVGRIADFGSANDPAPEASPVVAQAYSVPDALPAERDVPIVFTTLRSAPCAKSDRTKRRA
jgi:hypothetical protein